MKITEVIFNPALATIVESHHNQSCWSEDLSAEDILSEIGVPVQPNIQDARETVFRRCDTYTETYKQKVKPYESIKSKFRDFMELKRWNPTQPFGKSDKLFLGTGFFIRAVPNLKHAHITQDLSIVYKLDGGTIWLYGFYTHDELGTGQPPNKNNQRSMATRIANKTEADCPIGVRRPQPKYK